MLARAIARVLRRLADRLDPPHLAEASMALVSVPVNEADEQEARALARRLHELSEAFGAQRRHGHYLRGH